MKKSLFIVAILGLWFSLSACVTTQQSAPYQGAGAGAVIGAAAGALLDSHNPWRGAVIGGALGAAFGGTLADISSQASYQAARTNQPVVYQRGATVVEASPIPSTHSAETNCRKVRKRVWRNGTLITDRIEEICEGQKKEYTY
ncbi:YMGG-like glycine zipper-containing protein [Thermosulfuriphilus sp.]